MGGVDEFFFIIDLIFWWCIFYLFMIIIDVIKYYIYDNVNFLGFCFFIEIYKGVIRFKVWVNVVVICGCIVMVVVFVYCIFKYRYGLNLCEVYVFNVI